METEKTFKYFKYALGEIILVVIGILIALQINNWNQARKSRIQEIKIYKEILSDLNLTLEEVEKDMTAHQKILNKSKVLMEHLINKNAYNDSLINYLFASSGDLQVYPKTTGFDALNSIGLDLLTNDSVRIEITNLHQLTLDRIINEGWRETPTKDLGLLIDPFLKKHITPNLDGEQQTINYEIDSVHIYAPKIRDYQAFLNDTELIANLNRSINFRTGKIRRHYLTTQRIQRTIKSIEQELLRIE